MKKRIFHLLMVVMFLLFGWCNSQNPSQVGSWSDPITFGIVPVAVAQLPDGRLICWSSQFRNTFTSIGDGYTYTELFDPFQGQDGAALGEFTSNTNHDMFCPGINNLPDGRILSAGGTSSQKTSIYDWRTGLWSVADEMNIPRGYQGNVTLSDGSVFTVGGSWSGGAWTNRDAEVWTESTGWQLKSNIKGDDFYTSNDLVGDTQSPLYRADNHIWLWPAPDGSLFHAGPSERMHWINTSGNGTMISAGNRSNDGFAIKGTTVMFDVGKILKVGGSESYDDGDPANNNSYVIDINGGYGSNPTVTSTSNSLQFPRTMHNSTVLPNGEVLVTGGLSESILFSDSGARLTAELYSPSTNSWSVVAGMQTPRTYHSVSILLTDGRVFVGGGGLCDSTPGCVNHFDAEVYSPPYLFDSSGDLASRPSISGPEAANFNSSISVSGTSGIQQFSLVRMSAATHSTNNEQRRIPLSFSSNGGNYSLNIPNSNLLPPGYYMLFAIDSNGVPSIAEIVQIGEDVVTQSSNDPDMVVKLDFEENSGITVNDSSDYNNDFTIIERDDSGNQVTANDHSWGANGVFGNALELDGKYHNSNTLLQLPYNSVIDDIRDEITVSAWVWRDADSTVPEYRNGLPANVAVFAHDYPAIFAGFHNWLIKWSFRTTDGFLDCYAGHAPLNQWTHYAVTYDGQTARLFSNGIEVCTKQITGDLVLRNDSSPNSNFTASGFFEHRTNLPVIPSGNQSAITDELDGRLDDFRVYRKALPPSDIKSLYQEGLNTGTPNIPDCNISLIVPEFKIGTNGVWTTGNQVSAPEGSQIFIRAKNYSSEYVITTPDYDGPTFRTISNAGNLTSEGAYQIDTHVYHFNNSERNNGLFDASNVGQYALTTLNGCSTVIDVQIGASNGCITTVTPEYRLNGQWSSGLNDLTVEVGTEVVLSILPNGVNFTIELPSGTVVNNDYNLGSVDEGDEGTYIFTTVDGCVEYFNLTVNAPLGNQSPVAVAGSGQTLVDDDGNGFEDVQLDGSGSYDGDGSIVGYSWLEGPTEIATGATPTVSLSVGTHVLSLRVTDNEGAEDVATDALLITVLEQGTPLSCPDNLENDSPYIVLPVGSLVAGGDQVLGTSEETNGSSCGVEVTNNDAGQPWSRYRIPIVLSDHGISAGDDILIGVDGNDGSGNARIEIVRDNTPNTALGSSNFGSGWSRYETTITVPSGIQALDIWLYSNYIDSSGGGTSYYDNLSVVNLSSPGGNLAPTAIASSDVSTGELPLEVNFDGSGSSDDVGIVGYSWTFGDGGSGTGQTVSHTYTSTGVYTAVLTVTDGEGLTDTDNVTITVNAPLGNQSPVAVAGSGQTLVDDDGNGFEDVQLDGSGSYDGDGSIVGYSWLEGPTEIATGATPTVSLSVGTHVLSLRVTDNEGAEDVATDALLITVLEQGTPLSCPDNLENDSPYIVLPVGSLVAGGDQVLGTSEETNGSSCGVEVTNNDAGQPWSRYRIPIVLSDHGISAGDDILIGVDGNDGSGNARIEIVRDNTPNTALGSSNFGSGWSRYETTITVPSGIQALDIWLYSNYIDSSGGGTSYYDNLSVVNLSSPGGNLAPTAIASSDVSTGELPLEVNFDGSGSSDDVGIVGYSWAFGDGGSGTGQTVSHTYTSTGVYTAVLTVTDGEGLTDTDNVTITVNAPLGNQSPVAVAGSGQTLVDDDGNGFEDVQLDGSGSYDGDGSIVGYSWLEGPTEIATGATPTVSLSVGTHVLSLRVTDNEGAEDVATDALLITVLEQGTPLSCPDNLENDSPYIVLPVGSLVAGGDQVLGTSEETNGSSCGVEVTNNDAGQPWSRYRIPIVLSDHGISAGDDILIGVDGNDGSGNARIEIVRDNTPNTALGSSNFGSGWSRYETTITVPSGIQALDIWLYSNYIDSSGGGTSYYDNLSVVNLSSPGGNLAPTAIASSDVSTGELPLEVNFDGSGSSDDVGIVGYSWTFGDGGSGTGQTVSHTYTSAGVYTAVLTVTDGEGLTDTDNVTITVSDGTTPICSPLTNPWNNTDVGSVATSGNACFDGSTFEIEGSGADIWGSQDEFHFVYQQMSGDGEIVARVLSMENTNGWAKAGVMIRNGLSSTSAMALLSMHPNPVGSGSGYTLQQRDFDGGSMNSATANNIGPELNSFPVYLRLVRSGNTFFAYGSSTNGNWQLLGSRTINMNSQVYIGLAVTSHNDGALCRALFEDVNIQNTSSLQTIYPSATKKMEDLSIFPNPGMSLVQVVVPKSNKNGTLKIFDVMGRVIETIFVEENTISQKIVELDVSNYSQGMYYVVYDDSDGTSLQSQLLVRR